MDLRRVIAEQADELAELQRRSVAGFVEFLVSAVVGCAVVENRRKASGRKPGKAGASSSSRSLVEDADETLEIRLDRCWRCEGLLAGAAESARQCRQVVDARPAPPTKVTEYQRVSKQCSWCGTMRRAGRDGDRPRFAGAHRPGNTGSRRVADLRALLARRPRPRPAGSVDGDQCLHRVYADGYPLSVPDTGRVRSTLCYGRFRHRPANASAEVAIHTRRALSPIQRPATRRLAEQREYQH